MVKNTEWSDKQLEELLRNMPVVKDNRDPRDIYQQIMLKQKKQKRNRTWIMPSIAATAALLLLFVLSPSLISVNDSSKEMADKTSMNESTEESMDKAELELADESKRSSIAGEGTGNADNQMGIMAVLDTSAVYEQDTEMYDVITYGIPDANIQNIVPVTMLVEKNAEKTWLQQYGEQMKNIEEEQWGLSEYFPMEANFSYGENDKTIIVDIPYAKPYDYSTATENMFFQVLQESFENKGIEKILFMTEGNPGINFSHTGQVFEKDLTLSKGKKAYLLLNQTYLVPTPKQYSTIKEAIDVLKTEIQEYQLKPVIPNTINIESVEEQDNNLLITFTSDSVITATEESMKMIEAILLTAMEFNFETVKFENTIIEQIGPFNLLEPIRVPIAANKKVIGY